MQTFIDIMDAWPSDHELAADLGEKPTLMAVWRHRRSIPAPRWLDVADAARKRGFDGVTIELMARIAAERARYAA